MKKKVILFMAILVSLIIAQTALALPIATSTFGTGYDGWVPTVPSETSWLPNGGNPGGYVQANDIAGSSIQILAPSNFLGDWSDFDGNGSITFDHRLFKVGYINNEGLGIGDYEINISGSGGAARWTSTGPDDATDWVSLTALLDESNWMIVSGSWSSLLSSVTELRIRIEMVDNGTSTNRDIAGIDNISLNSFNPVPEPATFILFFTGIAGLIGFRIRSKGSNN